jgi:hypothetical protein
MCVDIKSIKKWFQTDLEGYKIISEIVKKCRTYK